MSWRESVQSAVLDDGRRVNVVQASPVDPWLAWVDDDRGATQSGGWLFSLLMRVLDCPPGKAPEFVVELFEGFAARETPLGVRYPCPCCDYLTLEESDAFVICEVCGWEDDLVQLKDPDYTGGANRPSLRQARTNYAEFGSSDKLKTRLRQPLPEEFPPAS